MSTTTNSICDVISLFVEKPAPTKTQIATDGRSCGTNFRPLLDVSLQSLIAFFINFTSLASGFVTREAVLKVSDASGRQMAVMYAPHTLSETRSSDVILED